MILRFALPESSDAYTGGRGNECYADAGTKCYASGCTLVFMLTAGALGDRIRKGEIVVEAVLERCRRPERAQK